VAAIFAPRGITALGQAGLLLGLTPDWNDGLYVGLGADGTVEVWTIIASAWSASPVAADATGLVAAVLRTLEARTGASSISVLIDGLPVLGPIAVPPALANGTSAGLYSDTSDVIANWPRFEAFTASAGP
jgi:hypothetical protein